MAETHFIILSVSKEKPLSSTVGTDSATYLATMSYHYIRTSEKSTIFTIWLCENVHNSSPV